MLELRPDCECCGADLPADVAGAHIGSFECTFCADCTAGLLAGLCLNCSGDLQPRPLRVSAALAKYPAAMERKHGR